MQPEPTSKNRRKTTAIPLVFSIQITPSDPIKVAELG